ncbi:MAG: proprotein convertase P-domain-containing protein, partial [Anaerolineales bacterium]|nr:proprotein convertase P-domain-containing protein [Anaerolineales bacterium]
DDPQEEVMPPDDPDIGDIGDDRPTLPQPEREVALAIEGGTWLAQGPGPSTNGQVENIPNGEVAGAVHTIAAHPTNPDILYAGGTNGGIWKTTNATSSSPHWIPLTDDKQSLSIGALEFDVVTGSIERLVAGIGRYSSFYNYGGPLSGLLTTDDGGETWMEIVLTPDGATEPVGYNISGLVGLSGLTLFSSSSADEDICANVGVFLAGSMGITIPMGPRGRAFDLVKDPEESDTFYTGMTYVGACSAGDNSNGIYKKASGDAINVWTKVSNAAMDALIVDGTTNNIEIAARGGNVFVNIIQDGQPAGIFYSSNGGTSWTAMDLPRIPIGTAAAVNNAIPGTPIIIDTGTPHGLVTDANGDDIHETAVEVQISNVTGTTGANGFHFIEVIDATSFKLNGSSDGSTYTGGGNWQRVVGMSPRPKPGGQGEIHASIRIDPNSGSTVYVGGDRQDRPFPNFIGAQGFTGSLFRGDASVAATGTVPSPQWEHLSHSNSIPGIPGGGTASSSAPHADSREIVFDVNGDLIEGDDGGIYRRTSPQNNSGDWFSLNGDLQITEIHDIAYDTLSNKIISGNQDNGTSYQTAAGGSTWNILSGGDGGDVAVDNIILAGSNQSVRYSSFQNLGGFRRSVWDSSGNEISTTYPALSVTVGTTFTAQFVTPVVTNNVVGNALLIGGKNGLYESTDGGSTIQEIGPGVVVNYVIGGHTLDYGSAFNAGSFLAATGIDFVYDKVSVRLGPGLPINTYTVASEGDVVRGVAKHPTTTTTGYAIDSDQVFMTTNGGSSWTDITGTGATGLTDNNLRSIKAGISSFATGASQLFVGGGMGVYKMEMSNPGVWVQLGTGLPHAPVWDLDYDPVDKVLVAGTLGRGAWTLSMATLACNEGVIDFEFGIPFATTRTNNVYWTTTADASGCDNVNETLGTGNAACASAEVTNSGANSYSAQMISNSFDLTGYSTSDDIDLNFTAAYRDSNFSKSFDSFGVSVSTDGGSTWTSIMNWPSDHYNPGEDVSLDLSAYAGLSDVRVRFYYSGLEWDYWAQVDDVSLACGCFAPAAPELNISYFGNDVSLNWSDTGADFYEIHSPANDFYFTPNINTLFTTATDTNYTFPNDLGNPNFNYAYAIIGKSSCGATSVLSNRTGEFDFGIVSGGPQTYTYDDEPSGGIAITSQTCGGSEIVRTFNVTDSFIVGDIDVGFNADHTYRGDLYVALQSPTGTIKQLVAINGADGNANYDILLDGDAGGMLDNNIDDNTAVPHYDRTVMQTVLNDFAGEAANGTWTMQICDNFAGDVGTYNRSRLIFTANETLHSDTARR